MGDTKKSHLIPPSDEAIRLAEKLYLGPVKKEALKIAEANVSAGRIGKLPPSFQNGEEVTHIPFNAEDFED